MFFLERNIIITCPKNCKGDGSLEAVFDGVEGGRPAAKPPPSSGDIRDTDLSYNQIWEKIRLLEWRSLATKIIHLLEVYYLMILLLN